MAEIELKNGYYIEEDSLNYTLKQRYTGTTKEGTDKESVRTCGYFEDIRRAVSKYIRLTQLDVLDGERVSMDEYVKSIEQADKLAVQGLEHVLDRFPIK